MATTVTLSYDLETLIGTDFDARRTRVYVEANTEVIVVDGTKIRLGDTTQTPGDDGTGSFSLIATNSASNPTDFRYRLTVDYTRGGRRDRDKWASSWFPLIATANIAVIPEAFDDLATPPEWRSEFRDEMNVIADVAAASATSAAASAQTAKAVSGADTADDLIVALDADTSSAFRQQQDARLEANYAPLVTGAPSVVAPAGLTRWKMRRNNALTTHVPIIFEGDSITAGAWADETGNPISAPDALAWANSGFVGKVRSFLAGIYGNLGEGFIGHSQEEARWAYSGSWSNVTNGVANTAARLAGGTTATITTQSCTTVTVAGVTYPDGQVPYLSVDGADQVPNVITSAAVNYSTLTAGWSGSSASVAYTTESGENVMDITATATGTAIAALTGTTTVNRIPVTAGKAYLALTEAKAIGSPFSTARTYIVWYDAAGNSMPVSDGYTVALGTAYEQLGGVVIAPAGATTAVFAIRRPSGVTSGEVMRVRRVRLVPLDWSKVAEGAGHFYRYSATGLTDAAHTVVLTAPPTNPSDSVGIICRKGTDSTAGIAVHRVARSGSTARQHAGTLLSASSRLNQLTGTTDGIAASPGLVVIMLGANDYNRQALDGLTPDTYEADLRIIVAKALGLGASALLVAGPRWEDNSLPYSQQEFYTRARKIALDTEHVAFFDLLTAWGAFSAADAAGFMYDSPHPNATGHADLARRMLDVILA